MAVISANGSFAIAIMKRQTPTADESPRKVISQGLCGRIQPIPYFRMEGAKSGIIAIVAKRLRRNAICSGSRPLSAAYFAIPLNPASSNAAIVMRMAPSIGRLTFGRSEGDSFEGSGGGFAPV